MSLTKMLLSLTWSQRYGRIAGALYLIIILGGTCADLVLLARLLVLGDSATTAL